MDIQWRISIASHGLLPEASWWWQLGTPTGILWCSKCGDPKKQPKLARFCKESRGVEGSPIKNKRRHFTCCFSPCALHIFCPHHIFTYPISRYLRYDQVDLQKSLNWYVHISTFISIYHVIVTFPSKLIMLPPCAQFIYTNMLFILILSFPKTVTLPKMEFLDKMFMSSFISLTVVIQHTPMW